MSSTALVLAYTLNGSIALAIESNKYNWIGWSESNGSYKKWITQNKGH